MAMDLGTGGGKPGRATPSMNVTPLVDVVLVLLIIFMVITPMLAKQFWLHLPNKVEKEEPAPPPDDSKPTIVVSVTGEGQIRINREVVAQDQFQSKLRRVLAGSGQRTVFFDADETAEFGRAVEAMDLARAGGAATVVVLTDPLPQ
jgi:biopolymer transport protein ExbD/biopolymer transport protein TolR